MCCSTLSFLQHKVCQFHFTTIMKQISSVFLLACSVGLAQGQHSVEMKFATGVSQSRLQETVHHLVTFAPRMGGTKRGDESANFVFKKLREYGLETEMIEDPELLAFVNEE